MTNITARKLDPGTELKQSSIQHEIENNGERTNNGEEERERWSSDLAYIVTTIGSAVGLGNLVRFPGYVQKFGAGAFFVPYFVAFFFIALPFFILETGLGQHFQGGWLVAMGRLHPRLRVIGFPFAGILALIFYSPLIAYVARMMFASFYSNGEGGLVFDAPKYNYSLSGAFAWVDEHILHINSGVPTMFDWASFGTTAFVWVLIWAYAFFGVKVSGYISYVTVGAPVAMIIVILIAAGFLDGVGHGMYMYLGNWDFSVLYTNPDIWSTATAQIMLSCSICLGFLSAFASYNDKKNNIGRSAVIICVGNSTYSIIAGFAIYAGLGHLVYRNATGMVNLQTANAPFTDPQTLAFDYITIESEWPNADYNFGFSEFLPKLKDGTYTFSRYEYKEWFSSNFGGNPSCMAIKEKDKCPLECPWVDHPGNTEGLGFCGAGVGRKVYARDLFPYIQPASLGLGLCFGSYPIVLGSLPWPHFWNFVFFLTLLLLGLDSAYALVEGINTFLLDTAFFRRFGRKKVHSGLCLLGFAVTSFFACDNGLVLVDTLSQYVDFLILFLGLVESIAVGWVYRYGTTASKCGKYATQMLMFAFFVPIVFGSTVGFGLASQPKDQTYATPLGFGLGVLLQAVLFPLLFYVASIDGNPKFSYKERLWELFFGNMEHLRNEFNRGCLDKYDENWYFTGIPKYWWTVCIKYVGPLALHLLLLIRLTRKKVCNGGDCVGQDDGTVVHGFGNFENYGPFWNALALIIVFGALLFIFVGFFLPPSIFEKFDAAAGEDLKSIKGEEDLKNWANDEESGTAEYENQRA